MIAVSVKKRVGHVGQRRAVILAATVVCLLVVMLFSRSVVKGIMVRHRAELRDAEQLQCLFILEAAVAKAQAALQMDREYRGELWKVHCDSARGALDGVAEISVESVENQTNVVRVQIQARYPDDPIHRIQHSKQLTVQLTERGAGT